MSKTTVWRVLRKCLVFNPLNAELNPICYLLALLGGATIVDVSRLRVKPYRIQMVQHLSDEDHRRRLDFCLQDLMSSGGHFLEKVQFSDEGTFHVRGAVNRRNVGI
jgi:hypothetical protein